jgi:FolB domain-containing protein
VINVDLFTDLTRPGTTDDIADCVDYQSVAEKVTACAQSARRFTVEALAADIARIGLEEPRVNRVIVRVEKPGAVRSCGSVGVEIERSRERGVSSTGRKPPARPRGVDHSRRDRSPG